MKATFGIGEATLTEVRRRTREIASEAQLPPEIRDDLVIAVAEAAGNAIRHTDSRRITLEWSFLPTGVSVTVVDEGIFRWDLQQPRQEPGGWGIPLMVTAADDVHIQPGTPQRPGTRVRVTKRVSRRGHGGPAALGRRSAGSRA